MDKYISMSYGSGGKKTSELINSILLPALSNTELDKLNDGAYIDLKCERLVFSTDSFVIKPLFFPGGDIGKLCVCGTVNDISVCGGTPKYLSLSLIIEEGFPTDSLVRVVNSIKQTADACGVEVVTGDTKVVEKGRCDGIYINTSGIGTVDKNIMLGSLRIRGDDKVIVSGSIGDHGLAIMAAREKLFDSDVLKSDCAPISSLTKAAIEFKDGIKIMRDPTRGGLATTLKEFIEGTSYDIKIYKDFIPVKDEVKTASDMLGIDPLYAANEGKVVIIADATIADGLLNKIREFDIGKDAAIIGDVLEGGAGRLLLDTGFGSVRIIDKLTGDQLPRIC